MIAQNLPAPKKARRGRSRFQASLDYARGRRGDGHAFAPSIIYATTGKDRPGSELRGERVLAEFAYGVASVQTAAFEMEQTAARARIKDPVVHFVISYDSSRGEAPDFDQIQRDVERLLRARGFTDGKGRNSIGKRKKKGEKVSAEDRKKMREAAQSGELNQHVIVAHGDTDNLHVHVIASRVAFNGVVNNDSHSMSKNEHVCADIAVERGWEIVLGNHNLRKVQAQALERGATQEELDALERREARSLNRLREMRAGLSVHSILTAAEKNGRQSRRIAFREAHEVSIKSTFEKFEPKAGRFQDNVRRFQDVFREQGIDVQIRPKWNATKERWQYGATFAALDKSGGCAGSDIGLSAAKLFEKLGWPNPPADVSEPFIITQEAATAAEPRIRLDAQTGYFELVPKKATTKAEFKDQSVDYINTMWKLASGSEPDEFKALLGRRDIDVEYRVDIGRKDGKLYPKLAFKQTGTDIFVTGSEIGIPGRAYHQRWPEAHVELSEKGQGGRNETRHGSSDIGNHFYEMHFGQIKSLAALTSSWDEYTRSLGERGVDTVIFTDRDGQTKIRFQNQHKSEAHSAPDSFVGYNLTPQFFAQRFSDFAERNLAHSHDKSGYDLAPEAADRSDEPVGAQMPVAEREADAIELPTGMDDVPPTVPTGSIFDLPGEEKSAVAQGFRASTEIMEPREGALTLGKPQSVLEVPKPRPDLNGKKVQAGTSPAIAGKQQPLGSREIAGPDGLWRGLHNRIEFSGVGWLGRWLRDIRSKRQRKLREQQDRADDKMRIEALDRVMDKIGRDRAMLERDRSLASTDLERERAEMKTRHLEIDMAYAVEKDLHDRKENARVERETKWARTWHNFKRNFSIWKVGAVAAIERDMKLRSTYDLKDRLGKSPAERRWIREENKKITRHNKAVRGQHRIEVAARKATLRADYAKRWAGHRAVLRAGRVAFADPDSWMRKVIADPGYDQDLRALVGERLALRKIDEFHRAVNHKDPILYFDRETQSRVERHLAGALTPVNEMARLLIEVRSAAGEDVRHAEDDLPGMITLDRTKVEDLIRARIAAGILDPSITKLMQTADAENRSQARASYEILKERRAIEATQKAEKIAKAQAAEVVTVQRSKAIADVGAWFDMQVKIRADLRGGDTTGAAYMMAQARQRAQFGRDGLDNIPVVDREGCLMIVVSQQDLRDAIDHQKGSTHAEASNVARLLAATLPNLEAVHNDGRPYSVLVVDRDQIKMLVEAGRYDLPDLLKASAPEIAANIKCDIDYERARKVERARQTELAVEARQARIEADVKAVGAHLAGGRLAITTDPAIRAQARELRAGTLEPRHASSHARLLALVGQEQIADRLDDGRHYATIRVDRAVIEAKIRAGAADVPFLIEETRSVEGRLAGRAAEELRRLDLVAREKRAEADRQRAAVLAASTHGTGEAPSRRDIMAEIARQDAEAEAAKAAIKPGVRPQIQPIAVPSARVQTGKHEIMPAERSKSAELKTAPAQQQPEPIRVQMRDTKGTSVNIVPSPSPANAVIKPVADRPDQVQASAAPKVAQPQPQAAPKRSFSERVGGFFGRIQAQKQPQPAQKPLQSVGPKRAVEAPPAAPTVQPRPVAETKPAALVQPQPITAKSQTSAPSAPKQIQPAPDVKRAEITAGEAFDRQIGPLVRWSEVKDVHPCDVPVELRQAALAERNRILAELGVDERTGDRIQRTINKHGHLSLYMDSYESVDADLLAAKTGGKPENSSAFAKLAAAMMEAELQSPDPPKGERMGHRRYDLKKVREIVETTGNRGLPEALRKLLAQNAERFVQRQTQINARVFQKATETGNDAATNQKKPGGAEIG